MPTTRLLSCGAASSALGEAHPGLVGLPAPEDRRALAGRARTAPRCPARDTSRVVVGVPPLSRADAWTRALRQTGEHR